MDPGWAQSGSKDRRGPVLAALSTGDLAALESAIDSVVPGGDTALYNVLYVTLKDGAGSPDSDPLHCRAIVVLTDGEDTASRVDDEQLLDLARRSGVVIYTIGLRLLLATSK
jgi:hypothetical protein